MELEKTGKLIRERRAQLGMRQEDLAEKVHVSRSAVSKWERGVSFPDVEVLEPLASALEISVSDLLSGKVKEKTDEEPLKNLIAVQKEKNEKRRRRIRITLAVLGILFFVNFCRAASFMPKETSIRIYGGEEKTSDPDDPYTSEFAFYYEFTGVKYISVQVDGSGFGTLYRVRKPFWQYLPFDIGNYLLGNVKDSGKLKVVITKTGPADSEYGMYAAMYFEGTGERLDVSFIPETTASKFHLASLSQDGAELVFENEEGKEYTIRFAETTWTLENELDSLFPSRERFY